MENLGPIVTLEPVVLPVMIMIGVVQTSTSLSFASLTKKSEQKKPVPMNADI